MSHDILHHLHQLQEFSGDFNQVMLYPAMNTKASVSLWPSSWWDWKDPSSLKIQGQSCFLHYLLVEILNFMTLKTELPNCLWVEMWEIGIPGVREKSHCCSGPSTVTPHGNNLTQWTVSPEVSTLLQLSDLANAKHRAQKERVCQHRHPEQHCPASVRSLWRTLQLCKICCHTPSTSNTSTIISWVPESKLRKPPLSVYCA